MTNQRLSHWLVECPQEHREFKYKYDDKSVVYNYRAYCEETADDPCPDVLIRRNNGEWEEPLIVIENENGNNNI